MKVAVVGRIDSNGRSADFVSPHARGRGGV